MFVFYQVSAPTEEAKAEESALWPTNGRERRTRTVGGERRHQRRTDTQGESNNGRPELERKGSIEHESTLQQLRSARDTTVRAGVR